MSEVASAVLAQDLCPCHAEGVVCDPLYRVWEVIIESRPSTPRVELGVSTAGTALLHHVSEK